MMGSGHTINLLLRDVHHGDKYIGALGGDDGHSGTADVARTHAADLYSVISLWF